MQGTYKYDGGAVVISRDTANVGMYAVEVLTWNSSYVKSNVHPRALDFGLSTDFDNVREFVSWVFEVQL